MVADGREDVACYSHCSNSQFLEVFPILGNNIAVECTKRCAPTKWKYCLFEGTKKLCVQPSYAPSIPTAIFTNLAALTLTFSLTGANLMQLVVACHNIIRYYGAD